MRMFGLLFAGYPTHEVIAVREGSKLVGIVALGAGMIYIVYPFLHECGHAVAAYLCGARDVQMVWFRSAYMACNAEGLQTWQRICIGVAGYLFPAMVTMLLPRHRFWCWLASFYIYGITWIGCLLAWISLMLYVFRDVTTMDDVIQVAMLTPDGVGGWLLVVFLLVCVLLWLLMRQKPIAKIVQYIA